MSPKLAMCINIAWGLIMAVCAFVARLTPDLLPSFVPSGADLIKTAAFLSGVWAAANAAFHAYSTSAPGPLGK